MFKPHGLASKLTPARIDPARKECASVLGSVEFAEQVVSLANEDYQAYITRNLHFIKGTDDAIATFAANAANAYGVIDRIEERLASVASVVEQRPPARVDAPTRSMWKSHCVQGKFTAELAPSLRGKLKEWRATTLEYQRLLACADDAGEYSDLSAYSSSEDEKSEEDDEFTRASSDTESE